MSDIDKMQVGFNLNLRGKQGKYKTVSFPTPEFDANSLYLVETNFLLNNQFFNTKTFLE